MGITTDTRRTNMIDKILTVLALSALCMGCSSLPFFGAQVTTVETVAEPPSDVTIFLTVQDGDEPVPHLSSDNFEIYENGVLLENDEIGLSLLPRKSVAEGFTVLLLDLSGPPTESELKRISRGAVQFVEKVSTTQPVAVVAFDGSERAREVARFSQVEEPVERELPELSNFISEDHSRDLNTAFLSAVEGVSAELKKVDKEGKFGTVVTLVRGPDLAGRKADSDLRSAVSSSGFEFFSLSPKGAKVPTLRAIGKTERFEFETVDTMPMRFQDLGMRVRASWYSHYLVSYCSPARAGHRNVKVKVRFDSEKGGLKTGSSQTSFEAENFSGGCTKKEEKPEGVTETPAEVVAEDTENPAEVEKKEEVKEKPAPQKRRPKRTNPPPPPPPQEEQEPEVVAPPSSGKYE